VPADAVDEVAALISASRTADRFRGVAPHVARQGQQMAARWSRRRHDFAAPGPPAGLQRLAAAPENAAAAPQAMNIVFSNLQKDVPPSSRL
jgi:hypothetical protein